MCSRSRGRGCATGPLAPWRQPMTETVPAPGAVEEPPPAIPIGERIAQLTAEDGDAPAVISGDTARSWTELDRRTNQLARALLARGVVLGDLVTIGVPN